MGRLDIIEKSLDEWTKDVVKTMQELGCTEADIEYFLNGGDSPYSNPHPTTPPPLIGKARDK